MSIQMKSKIPLQGTELEEYLQKEKVAKDKQAAEEAAMARTQQMLEADEDDSETDDSDDEDAVEQTLEDDDAMIVSPDGDAASPSFAEPGVGSMRRRGRGRSTDMGDWGIETEDGTTKQMLSYDIYVKGNVSKATSFFKANSGQTQRFRMFPYIERKRRVDEYGEVVDVGMWLRKGKILEEEAEGEGAKENRRRQEADEEARVSYPASFCSALH